MKKKLTHFGLVDLFYHGARLTDQVFHRLAHGGLLRLVLRRLRLELLALPRQRLRLHGQHVHLFWCMHGWVSGWVGRVEVHPNRGLAKKENPTGVARNENPTGRNENSNGSQR